MEQLHAVLEAEEKSTAQLGVCQQNRYEPRMIWLMDYIKEHGVKSGLGIVSWKRDTKYYASGAWRGKIIEEGGGVMINQALHTLDLLQHLCGMPTHVTAHTDNDYHKDCIEVEDTATAHFELPDGMMCHFYGTTAATADLPVQLQFVTMDKVRVIAGNDFVLLNGKPVEIEDTRDHANLVGKTVWGTGHAILIRDFYDCIANGRPFPVSGKEAAKVVRLILSMYQSGGKRIEILS
jgi:predicted dehydrogenase